jgi:hypothetical protein
MPIQWQTNPVVQNFRKDWDASVWNIHAMEMAQAPLSRNGHASESIQMLEHAKDSQRMADRA